jgi:hypothetical protein
MQQHDRRHLPILEAVTTTTERAEAPPPNAPARKGKPRGRTESIKRLSKKALAAGAVVFPPEETASYAHLRPANRGECLEGANNRPCPWVSCKYHLALDVSERTGSIKTNYPDVETWQMGRTCALDEADRGGMTLEDVADALNLTRERIRQIETKALRKLRESGNTEVLTLLLLSL